MLSYRSKSPFIFKSFLFLWLFFCTNIYGEEIKYFENQKCDGREYDYDFKCSFKKELEIDKSDLVKYDQYYEAHFNDKRLIYSLGFFRTNIYKELLEGIYEKNAPHIISERIEYDLEGRVILHIYNPLQFANFWEYKLCKYSYGEQEKQYKCISDREIFNYKTISNYKNNRLFKKSLYSGPNDNYTGYISYDHKAGIRREYDSLNQLEHEETDPSRWN